MTKRKSKHAPKEVSSKFPVSRFKQISFPKKGGSERREKPRDPRFERYAGHFNQNLFEKSFGFVEEYVKDEVVELEKALRGAQGGEERDDIRRVLNRKREELRRRADRSLLQQAKKQLQDKEKAAIQRGKKPYFLKRKVVKLQAMKMRMDQLQAAGTLEQYEAKKRKREQQKEKVEKVKFARTHL